MKAQNCGLKLENGTGTLTGSNASVACTNNKIVLDPGAGSAKVCGITFQRREIKAAGAMELKAGVIKIG